MQARILILFLLIGFLFLSFGAYRVYAKERFNEGDRNWSKNKIKRYIDKKWASRPKDAKKAKAIFTAESGLNCTIVGNKSDVGVAQINKIHWNRFGGKDSLKSCKKNIDAAYIIYKEWGNNFRAWTAYQNGSYKKYL